MRVIIISQEMYQIHMLLCEAGQAICPNRGRNFQVVTGQQSRTLPQVSHTVQFAIQQQV